MTTPMSRTSKKRRAKSTEAPAKRSKSTVVRSDQRTLAHIAENKALTTRLDVYVFGEGSSGELGLGPKNAVDVKRPRLNTILDAKNIGVVDIATGGMHVVALTHDGKVLTWGVNDNFALGRQTSWEGGMKDIDPTGDESASDTSDGELNPFESTPTAIPGDHFLPDTTIVRLTAGDSATFVLTQHGLVYGWGTFVNNEGKPGFLQVQTNEITKKQSKPTLIPGLKRIVQISAGNNFCLALDVDGKVYSWGMSEQNQLGRRLIVHRYQSSLDHETKLDILYNRAGLSPGLVALPKRKKIVSIHAGSDHAFAIDSNGDTWAWGLNDFGQTGISRGAGTGGATVVTPQKVQALMHRKMKMIQGGSHHSIGITQAGECLVWGRIDGGQMGLDISALLMNNPASVILERGKPRILVLPTALPISGSAFAAAGSDHSILITSQGKAYSWGFNTNYQCGQGSDIDEICVATLINNSAVRDKNLTWAGAGGQYSLLAGPHQQSNNLLTNGVRNHKDGNLHIKQPSG